MNILQAVCIFCFGFGTAVIVFLGAAWSVNREPKVKSDKNYKDEVDYFLELDDFEKQISA